MRLLLPLLLVTHLLLCREFSNAGEEPEIAISPPRGWNSYDSFNWFVDEAAFLNNAGIMEQKLLPHGYQYVVIDFLWYRKDVDGASLDSYGYDNIDKWGRPFPDPVRWPSSQNRKGFSEVARLVHAMGLKFGIHVMRGISTQAVNTNTPILDVHTGRPYEEAGRSWSASDIGLKEKTCAWMKHGFMSVNTDLGAGRAFLRSLYRQYADWGVDFVKLDCVFGSDFSPKEVITISELLEELDRPVVFSISPGDSVNPSLAEGISSYVNMYRITADDWDKWHDVASHFNVSRDFAAAKKIGANGHRGRSWPDLDMLPLGWLTSVAEPRPQRGPYRKSNLTLDEQRTQMTLWSMARSPLMFGGDLRQIDTTTLSLITNPTILEINSYSTNNMEFPHVYASRNPRIRSLQVFENRVYSDTPADITLGLTSCNDERVKGWFAASQDGKPDRICWNPNPKTSAPLPYCLSKTKLASTWDGQENFHLLAKETDDACLEASVSTKKSAPEKQSAMLSTCKRHANQIWGLNENGTLVNSYSNLCARIISKKESSIDEGIRSWIATGRKGEIYLAFFNLNPFKTQIAAKLSDLGKAGPCEGSEVWSGRRLGMVREELSAMVNEHGALLFVLNC